MREWGLARGDNLLLMTFPTKCLDIVHEGKRLGRGSGLVAGGAVAALEWSVDGSTKQTPALGAVGVMALLAGGSLDRVAAVGSAELGVRRMAGCADAGTGGGG